jgi:mRNA interferase HigB
LVAQTFLSAAVKGDRERQKGQLRLPLFSFPKPKIPVDPNFAKCEDMSMRIVSRKAIREAIAEHGEWKASLSAWYKIASNADWGNFAEVRNSWNRCDAVGRFVVFDISHNKCRLIATVKYKWRMLYIRHILDHAEYDKKDWLAE